MTIDELIEKLAQYPGDYEVVMDVPPDNCFFDEISDVKTGHYDWQAWDPFIYNGNGKCVDVNAVALVGA